MKEEHVYTITEEEKEKKNGRKKAIKETKGEVRVEKGARGKKSSSIR